MDMILALDALDVFIVEVTMGVDYEGENKEVKLLTQSRDAAFEKARALSENLELGYYDYGFITVSGGFFDSSMPPIRLFQCRETHAEHGYGYQESQIDEAAGGIDVLKDAVSENNNAAFHMLRIEQSLSQSRQLIGRFASMKCH